MKKLFRNQYSVYMACFLAGIAIILSSSFAMNKAKLSAPRIVFEQLIHDFGTIAHRSDGTCHFRFTNRGDAPLVITGVTASCGCTVPTYTREPVLPGQSGQIKVEYNTRLRGTFNKTIAVNTNDPNNPSITLTVKGTVAR
jgi:hypothetical protein